MNRAPGAGPKAIATVRIATGVIFLFFAEYKIVSPAFAYGGFESWIHQFVDNNMPVGFFRVVLVNFALVHPVLCARIVAWGELAIGLSLVLSLLVRPASAGGAILMIALALSTWYAPGHGAAAWKYLGANLDHIPLLFLFVIFYATRAGETWGLDGRRNRSRPVPISGFGQSRHSSSQS
ncbi:MAG: DoxX family membrane protein [Candidatus Acidiferrales bacterium]